MPPERKPQGRRPAKGNQKIMNVVLWVASSGTPWRELPDSTTGYGIACCYPLPGLS
ncbi:transposase [Paenibacillus brasilensis]|uniref:Transposase n=1 Tax=Paenibacillus brasilensis TaxID=128574 RepID=A0ABU0KYV7_9BACL|nr:transposase [Paenibacillus brasilensis]